MDSADFGYDLTSNMYVLKPTPVECYQITEDNIDKLAAWSSTEIYNRPDGSPTGLLALITVEGNMTGVIGDYIIKNQNHFYFCDKEVFERTYEKVL